MPKYKLSLSTDAGELDSKEIEVSDEEMENSGEGATLTAALIEWLEEGMLVSDGDTITVREIETDA